MRARYFPQRLANQPEFRNREQERAELADRFSAHEHTVLIAPRRYGKTSLIQQVLNESPYPTMYMDFFFVLTERDVIALLKESLSTLLSALLPAKTSAKEKVIASLKSMNPKLTLNLLGQTLELGSQQTDEKTLTELLLALDQAAREVKTTCVLVFDEFQQIGELKENHAIEAAIRHAVERSKNVSYLFCGSKQHLLDDMFSNRSRPLYHLCDLMHLKRIDHAAYRSHLKKMARKRWKTSLAEESIEEILHLTERHAYYVNALCRHLWRADTAPSLADVRRVWAEYITQQSPWMIADLSQLSLNRKKLLTALAKRPTQQPQSSAFCLQAGLTASTIQKSLADCQKLDLVWQDAEHYYRVLDPALAYFIRARSYTSRE